MKGKNLVMQDKLREKPYSVEGRLWENL